MTAVPLTVTEAAPPYGTVVHQLGPDRGGAPARRCPPRRSRDVRGPVGRHPHGAPPWPIGSWTGGSTGDPLQGIPLGMKDILAAAEAPTTANSLVLDRDWGAGRDAPVVARLKAAGAVITGKVTTLEFAFGFPDPAKPFPFPRNPWNPDNWPGGSSSGTGAVSRPGSSWAASGRTRAAASASRPHFAGSPA